MLRERNVALVLHDLHYMPELDRLTADFTVIRLQGRRADVPDDTFDQVRVNRDREIAGGVVAGPLDGGADRDIMPGQRRTP